MICRHSILTVALAVGLLAVCPTGFAQTLKLLPNKTVLAISSNATSSEKQAAIVLQKWLRKASVSNAGFDVLTETAALKLYPEDTIIAIGATQWAAAPQAIAALNDDGFLIHAAGSIISISAKTPDGAFYGAMAFLDRYAGVRFYMPGDQWTSLPENHEVAFYGGDYASQPFVTSCDFSGIKQSSSKDDPAPVPWVRLVAAARLKGGTHQHNLYAIFPPSQFAQSHPEIYPIYDGKRFIPKSASDSNWQIRFSEPATLECAKLSITAYFASDPGVRYIAVSINDNSRWAEDDDFQKTLAQFKASDPSGNYKTEAESDIYWRFMNQLGAWMMEAFPEKLLVGLAYGPTSAAPQFKLSTNIVAYTVMHIGEIDGYLDAVKGKPAILNQWLDVAHHLGNHDWYEGDGYLIPRIYSGYWSRYMKALAANLPDAFIHCEAYPNWGLDGPKFYIAAKLWWDPKADPKTLTSQFCQDMFGPAAFAMRDYFTKVEDLWVLLDEVDGPKRKIGGWQNQFLTTPTSRSLIAACRASLNEAEMAGGTSEQKDRIMFFSRSFALSESLFALAASPSDAALHQKALHIAQEIAKLPMAVNDPTQPEKAIEEIFKPKK